MKKLALITAASALAAFMTTGSAVANHLSDDVPEQTTMDACTEAFNELWGPPGENKVVRGDKSARDDAQERNEDRKLHCTGLPDEEPT